MHLSSTLFMAQAFFIAQVWTAPINLAGGVRYCAGDGHPLDAHRPRGFLIARIEKYCKYRDGHLLKPGKMFRAVFAEEEDRTGLQLSIMNKSRRPITIRGNGNPDDMCGRAFREPIDNCDTHSTNSKYGGSWNADGLEWKVDIYNCIRGTNSDICRIGYQNTAIPLSKPDSTTSYGTLRIAEDEKAHSLIFKSESNTSPSTATWMTGTDEESVLMFMKFNGTSEE
jgi:hypothetical protein